MALRKPFEPLQLISAQEGNRSLCGANRSAAFRFRCKSCGEPMAEFCPLRTRSTFHPASALKVFRTVVTCCTWKRRPQLTTSSRHSGAHYHSGYATARAWGPLGRFHHGQCFTDRGSSVVWEPTINSKCELTVVEFYLQNVQVKSMHTNPRNSSIRVALTGFVLSGVLAAGAPAMAGPPPAARLRLQPIRFMSAPTGDT